MNPIVISCLISAALIVSSCNGSVHSDPNSKDYASNNYKSKAKIIETFINIDYESAYEIAVEQTEDNQTFNPDVIAIHSEYSTPWMLYLLTADCSLCIVAALDFMQSFCHLRLDFETPVIVLKEGDKEIFDFYKEKLFKQIIPHNKLFKQFLIILSRIDFKYIYTII